MTQDETSYDIIEGISAGAINAGVLGTFEVGDEKRAVEWLKALWMKLPAKDTWENWPFLGPLEAIYRPSALDNSIMSTIVRKVLAGREFQRQIALLAVDLDTGEIVIFDETTPHRFMSDAVIASASIPTVFPPVSFDHKTMVDGGIFANVDVSESIIKCRDMGFADEDIIIDAILCFDKVIKVPEWHLREIKYKNAWDMFARHTQLKEFYYYFEDIIRVVRGYPKVNFRHLISPL